MQSRTQQNIIIALLIALVLALGIFFWRTYNGLKPAILPPPDVPSDAVNGEQPGDSDSDTNDESQAGNETPYPLSVPDGFTISILTDEVPEARVLRIGPQGKLWVSQTRENTISVVDTNSGQVTPVFTDLNRPHGLAFDPQDPFVLYFAEQDAITKVRVSEESEPEHIADLPAGGRHFTRTLGFGPDDRLYVSIGSSCDTCVEDDDRRAAIYSMNKDGSDFTSHAQGLRNAVFFTWSEVDGRMWATEMGRDHLGDDLPPDEIVVVEEGNHYGWPFCYGNNVHDATFDDAQSAVDFCENEATPSAVDLQAHSAPLGLDFVPEEGWPEDMWYDLIVAYHGSWNRTEPTGYKLMRIKMDAEGNVEGREDFISGWLREDGRAHGRPVDVLMQPGGLMYVSDDKAGAIYRITWDGGEPEQQNGSYSYQDSNVRIIEPDDFSQSLTSPIHIEGEAIGPMYFEASFGVSILDANNNVLGTGPAEAQGNWMTTNFVPFTADITFQTPTTATGTLLLENANPSGEPQNAVQIHIPIVF